MRLIKIIGLVWYSLTFITHSTFIITILYYGQIKLDELSIEYISMDELLAITDPQYLHLKYPNL